MAFMTERRICFAHFGEQNHRKFRCGILRLLLRYFALGTAVMLRNQTHNISPMQWEIIGFKMFKIMKLLNEDGCSFAPIIVDLEWWWILLCLMKHYDISQAYPQHSCGAACFISTRSIHVLLIYDGFETATVSASRPFCFCSAYPCWLPRITNMLVTLDWASARMSGRKNATAGIVGERILF